MSSLPNITVCLCTFKRPVLLKKLLEDLEKQATAGLFSVSIAVADNDPAESARSVVEEFKTRTSLQVTYLTEPRRSISQARNKSIEPATGEFIAFIDDDEFPADAWLLTMFKACAAYNVPGVFGPVRTAYTEETPDWVKRGGFYERPEHPTGYPMPHRECRTGNVLVKRKVLFEVDPVFRAEFGGGASDQDTFRRLMERGHRFIWCNEGIVYEVLPPGRCKRVFLMRRAILRGSLVLKFPGSKLRKVANSLVAVPLYALALPVLQLRGHHLFMKYLVKLCDHCGLLLAAAGIYPIRVRDME